MSLVSLVKYSATLAVCCLSAASYGIVPHSGNMCVTGTVIHATQHSFLLQNDRRQNIKVIVQNAPSPKTGDRITLSCRVEYTRFNEPDFFLERFTASGHEHIHAPVEMKIEDIAERPLKNVRVTIVTEIEDYFIDEVDTRYYYLSLKSRHHRIYGTLNRASTDVSLLENLIGATVRLTGTVFEQQGARGFGGNRIALDDINTLSVVSPAEKDLSQIPELNLKKRWLPIELAKLPRQRISGTVQAVWKNKIIVSTPHGESVQAVLRSSGSHPGVGDCITVAGYPSTDFFHLSLSGAKWQSCHHAQNTELPVRKLFNNELFTDVHGNHSIDSLYHGTAVCVRGTVMRGGEQELEIDLGRDTIRAYAGRESSGFASIEPGSRIELTGIAVLESDLWREGAPFPRIRGISIVTRYDSDIKVIRRPPWWTTERVIAAFAGFILLVAGLSVWNWILIRITTKRSRELVREQMAKERSKLKTDERTRLAIELHDSLSQNLSGIGCQLVAARLALKSDEKAGERLKTAEHMLQSTRTELKRCLFDLRENLLESMDFEHMIRQTLRHILGPCRLRLKFHVIRSVTDDSQAHTVISIIRELVSNATIHGKATGIFIAGALEQPGGKFSAGSHSKSKAIGKRILFSVRDNGTGFDPESCCGPATGHFGLTGIRDRINRFGGEFHIKSSDAGTYARISLPL